MAALGRRDEKLRILIVDSEKESLKVVECALRDQCPSCKIDMASNGLEALRQILVVREQFDVIVAEVDMQPVSGDDLDTIVGILNRRKVTDTRIVLMSSRVERRPGDFIEKPFSGDELGAKIWEILDKDETVT